MPRKDYKERLSDEEIIKLFRKGQYHCNLETGKVYSERTKSEVFTYSGNDEGYLFIRVYEQPKHRTLPLSQLIWLVGTGSPLPKDFEVHHRDKNFLNNAFENLYALHKVDHRKLHESDLLPSAGEEIPF